MSSEQDIKSVALITGAGSGIGRGFAHEMARLGHIVIVTDINEESAKLVVREIRAMGKEAIAFQFDVTDAQAAERIVDTVIREYGHIDFLFANAGLLGPAAFEDIQPSDWDAMLGVNIKGTAIICQVVSHHMKEQRSGRIITTASYNAVRVDKHVIPYRVDKSRYSDVYEMSGDGDGSLWCDSQCDLSGCNHDTLATTICREIGG